MDSLKSLVKKKRLFTSFLKYDLLNQAAAETNLYSDEKGRELEELAQDNPVAAVERLLDLIRLHSTYEAFISTLERSIEIGHSQQRTVLAQAHEQLINEITGEKKPKGFKVKIVPQEARKNALGQKVEFEMDQDDDPLMDRDLLDSTNSGHHPIPEETVTEIFDPRGISKRSLVAIHGEQMRQDQDPLMDASDLFDITNSGHHLIPEQNASALSDSRDMCKRIPGTIHGERGFRPGVPYTANEKKSKDRLSRSKSDHTTGSLLQRHSPGIQQDSRDRASSMNSPDYKWGSKLHPNYTLGKNQGSLTITDAISTDTGLGSSMPSLADIQDDVEDDTDGVVRGKEQQPEDIHALFSKFSNIESVILDQQHSFEKGIARLQQGQDELKKSVTAEYRELKKQIEELKVTVTALQELSLTNTPSNNHGRMDMHQDMETTATITSRSEESLETTSTSSEDNNDYIVHTTNSNTPAHEAKLHRLCWIPFGIQTLTVGQEGGLFPLQPQGSKLDDEGHNLIMMEVAKKSVNTAVCDRLNIRYGVIVHGSFNIPNGYQLGSMVVYIYFEQEHATKPVVLHLPHWVGSHGQKNLKWVIAPHKLEENEELYPFQLAEGEAFDNRYGAISINGHCSLFGTVFEEEASYKEGLRYYATGLETYVKEGACLHVKITYASQAWLQILEKYQGNTLDSTHVLFTFKDTSIKGTLSEKQGNGWSAWLNANSVVHRDDVEYKSHGIRNAGDMKRAVKTAAYPPFISCQTTYRKEVRRTGVPTKVVLQIEGVKDKDMPFLCTAYEYRSEIERRRPVGHSDSLSPLPTYQTQTGSEFKLKLKDLMPYIDDLKDSGLQIAGYLDLTTNWTSIARTNPDSADCLVTLLDMWLKDTEVESCPHTWDYFIHIVRKLHKGKLADKMAREIFQIRNFQTSDADV